MDWRTFVSTVLGIAGLIAAGVYLGSINPKTGVPSPITVNGQTIEFTWTDENAKEDLIIYTDKVSYADSLSTAEVYVAIANQSGVAQNIELLGYFKDDKRRIKDVSILSEITEERLEPVFEEVCDVKERNLFNAEKQVYEIVKAYGCDQEQTGTTTVQEIRNEWVPLGKTTRTEGERIKEQTWLTVKQGVERKTAPGFVADSKVSPYLLPDGGVLYYKLNLQFLPNQPDSFFIEAIGDQAAYGHLDPYFDPAWDYRVKVEVVPSKVGSSTAVTAFPVYNDCGGFPASFWTNAQGDGDDIRVTEGDEVTETPFELVSFSTTSQKCELHFLADTMGTTSTSTFYVYYGNPSASAYASTSSFGSQAVWTDYKAVYHGEGNFNSATGLYNPTSETNITYNGEGKLGQTTKYASATSRAEFGNPAGLQMTTVTTQLWARSTTSQSSYRGLLARHQNIGAILTLSNQILTYDWGGGGGNRLTGVNINDGNWKLIHSQAVSGSSNTAKVHINGEVKITTTVTNSASDSWYIGQISSSAGQNFAGEIDEMRIRNSLLSDSWIITEFNNQNATSTFFAIGAEESNAPDPGGATTTIRGFIGSSGFIGGSGTF